MWSGAQAVPIVLSNSSGPIHYLAPVHYLSLHAQAVPIVLSNSSALASAAFQAIMINHKNYNLYDGSVLDSMICH